MQLFGLQIFGGRQGVVGLDIGSSSIKMAQVNPRRDGFDLVRIASSPVPPEAIVDGALMNFTAIGEAVKNLVQENEVKVRKAACSISGNSVIAKVVTMPAMGAAEMDEQIHWEAEQHIPFSIQDVYLDFQVLARREGEMSVLLVAAKKEVLAEYRNIVADAGLEMCVMDVDALAMYNCFHLNHFAPHKAEFQDGLVGLVNIGAAMTSIVIVRHGVPTFLRDVPTGGNVVTSEIQKSLQLSFEDAEAVKTGGMPVPAGQERGFEQTMAGALENIVQEIQRTADFYLGTAGEEGIQRYFLTGGTTKASAIFDLMRGKLGVPVEPLNPFSRAQSTSAQVGSDAVENLSAVSAVGIGLALRQPQDAFNKS